MRLCAEFLAARSERPPGWCSHSALQGLQTAALWQTCWQPQLSGWDSTPHPEQCSVCMVACLLGPLQSHNVLPGVCRSRVQYLCQDDLPQLGIFPAEKAQQGQSQICLWTPPAGISQICIPLAGRTKPGKSQYKEVVASVMLNMSSACSLGATQSQLAGYTSPLCTSAKGLLFSAWCPSCRQARHRCCCAVCCMTKRLITLHVDPCRQSRCKAGQTAFPMSPGAQSEYEAPWTQGGVPSAAMGQGRSITPV